MSERHDPIGQLVEALAREGKPSLAWVLRWSTEGRDPVAAAWAATEDADAMHALLARVRPRKLDAVIAAVERALGPGWYHRSTREIAPVMKRAVEPTPTLREVLADYA